MAAPRSYRELADLIVECRLLDQGALRRVLREHRREDPRPDPGPLADRLVRAGLLTPFQADRLLQGKWRNCVLGRYKVLQPLGTGGMGRVFLCEHTTMRRRVAVKVLPARAAATPGAVRRFLREARATGAMDHPNIVRAYDVGQSGTVLYLSMEYVPGANLGEIVRGRGPLTVGQAAEAVRQAALGLQHAHAAGWVHRDVKPDNLLLSPDGVVKVLDLGLARAMGDASDRLTEAVHGKAILGTIDFLSPEQVLDSSSVDGRADIYSLGATLYYLLAGRSPVPEGTVAEKLAWHLAQHPPPARPDVPDGLAAVLARMMAKDRAARPQTPGAVAEALAPWAAGPAGLADLIPGSPPTDEPTPPTAHARPVRRRGVLVALALTGLAAAGVTVALVPADRATSLPVPAAPDPPVLTPAEAAARVDQEVFLTMTVASTGLSQNGGSVFLNSESDFRHPDNFKVMIPKGVVPEFGMGSADDLRRFLDGKAIRVRGTVVRFNDRPEIVVQDRHKLRVESD